MPRRWQSETARALIMLTGVPDPVAAMVARADALLDDADVTGPPTPLEVLASFQGITGVERVAMRPSGRLVVAPGQGALIQINQDESQARQNFTIAHEIAHTLIPSFAAGPRSVEDSQTGDYPQDDEEEHLCDIGASALLLPERWLRPAASAVPPSLGALERIARRFRASLEATARAVARLDLWPFALVIWEPGWRKKDRPAEGQTPPIPPALRVSRAIAAPSFGFYIPRNKSAPEGSSIHAAFTTQSPTRGQDWLTVGQRSARLVAESAYYALQQDGVVKPRVVSFLQHAPESGALDQAG